MTPTTPHLTFAFDGEPIEWRGPTPYVFVRLPDDIADDIRELSPALTYGWGCIPAVARTGDTEWTTSMFPRDGGYLLPVKVAVQRSEGIGVGDVLRVELEVGQPR